MGIQRVESENGEKSGGGSGQQKDVVNRMALESRAALMHEYNCLRATNHEACEALGKPAS
jgi:hypothetical protein